MFEKMKDIVALAKKDAAKFMADQFGQTANITGIAMAIFVLVVIGYVSIFVVNEIHGIAGITSGSVFYTASNKVISVMNTSWGMMLIVVIAVLAGVKFVPLYLMKQMRNHRSNQRRAWGRWNWRNFIDKISIEYNKRGQTPSPTFIFST